MSSGLTKRPGALWVLICVLVFQGISATPPGLLLILDPTGGLMHMPLSMLRRSIFGDFLVPGLILCVVLGLGAFLVAAGLYFLPTWPWVERFNPCERMHWSWTAAVGFGAALMIWIMVQVFMIGGGSWLQPLYFAAGLAILLASLVPSVRRHMASPRPPHTAPDRGSAP
jgi:hypothetical protein